MPLGLYISVPFCRSKCSYCNFASDVFSRAVFARYIDRVCSDIERATETADRMGARMEQAVDSVYLGGGTPTVLDIAQLGQLFVTISQNFEVQPEGEVTVECAPGTLSEPMLETLIGCGVNRVSLGVQSFVDAEAASVGRLHKRATVLDDIAHLRAAGISKINIDLIAGLPHQNAASWETSLGAAIASGVPHVSVYMLEIDDDSRLGRELIAGGTRYHAHFVPDEDLTADFYVLACEQLEVAGVRQYEISNFAREGFESRHNLKYWTRQPYLGFGVDAHSMLKTAGAKAPTNRPMNAGLKARSSAAMRGTVARASASVPSQCADTTVEGHGLSHAIHSAQSPGVSPWGDTADEVRFATPDSLDAYLAGTRGQPTPVSRQAALEEIFFLGLRLTRGVDLRKVAQEFGDEALVGFRAAIAECVELGLLERDGSMIRLTPRGRLLSNEVFQRFVTESETV